MGDKQAISAERFIIANLPTNGAPFVGQIKLGEARKFTRIKLNNIPKGVPDDATVQISVYKDELESVGAPVRKNRAEDRPSPIAKKIVSNKFFRNEYYKEWAFLYDEMYARNLDIVTWDKYPVVVKIETLTELARGTWLQEFDDYTGGLIEALKQGDLYDGLLIVNSLSLEIQGFVVLHQRGNVRKSIADPSALDISADLFMTKRISGTPLGQYLFAAAIYEGWKQGKTSVKLETMYFDEAGRDTPAFKFYLRYAFKPQKAKLGPGDIGGMTLKIQDLGNVPATLERLVSDQEFSLRKGV